MLSGDPTWSGLGHGLLILAALWWAWAAYAWLTNTVDPEVGAVWGAMLFAMAAMFVAALAVPDAFGRHGVVFGVAFLIVKVMHLTLYALGARDDRDLLAAILRIAPLALAGAALIVAAGFVHGALRPLLWLAALAVGLFGPLLGGLEWLATATRPLCRASRANRDHCDRRVSGRHRPRGGGHPSSAPARSWPRCSGFLWRRSFWLAYFDFFPIRGQQLLTDRSGAERAAFARDIYTYLHLPMVAGVILFAFALKTTLAHVGDELDAVPAFGLCVGPALYLFAYVGFVSASGARSGGVASSPLRLALCGRWPLSRRRSSRSHSWPWSGSPCTHTS